MSSADDDVTPDCGVIEMNLRDAGQLFDNLDPSPLHARDLHRSVEEYIVESVQELPTQALCALVVHLDQSDGGPDEAGAARDSIHAHFARRAQLARRDLRQLIRRGCISLGIGLAFLVMLFMIAQGINRIVGETGFVSVVREPTHRWLGGDVEAAGNLSLRLVANRRQVAHL